MKFGELKTVINRHPGRHDWIIEENGYKVEEGMLCYIIRW